MRTPGQAPTGMRVGDYALLARIGEGGMGVVHLARKDGGERVALKVLRPHVVGDAEARERLAREVKSLSRVRSSRVAEIVDADPWGPVPFVATRYVPGLNLHDHVAEEGVLAGEELLRFARGLAEALQAVHAVGVLHRDIKPTNVLMEGRSPVLIDFGLARLAEDERITRTGFLMGTPGYLAPEVLHGNEPAAASDVHAWAATVAFAGLGRPPFGRGPSVAVMDRVRRGEHDLDGLGFEVLALVTAALDPDPTKRPTLPELVARTGGAPRAPGTPRVDPPAPTPTPTMTMPIAAAPDFTATEQFGTAGAPQADAGPTPHQPVMEPARQPYQQPPAPQGALPSAQQPSPQRVPWPVRIRRWVLGLALLGASGAAMALAPWVTCFLVATVVVLCRSTSLFSSAAAQRRNRRGTKWYDAPLDVVSAPWHFLVSLPLSLLLLAWAAMLAACVGLLLLVLGIGDVPMLVSTGVVIGAAVWTGPGGSRVRQPIAGMARPLSDSTTPWLVAVMVLLVTASALLAVTGIGGTVWLPFADSPWSGDSWLARL